MGCIELPCLLKIGIKEQKFTLGGGGAGLRNAFVDPSVTSQPPPPLPPERLKSEPADSVRSGFGADGADGDKVEFWAAIWL